SPQALAADPENELYSRKPLLRLEAEALRDSLLAVSGSLSLEAGGPPVPVSFLASFDAPLIETNCTRRGSSIAATQALVLLNGSFAREEAAQFALRLE